jgi:sigma-B regulation protein RsbU (phosphoserine phosphatase)
MAKGEADLLKQIQELEAELQQKNAEVLRYRSELQKANHSLESMISDLAQELKYASAIQRVLSPTEIPNIPGIDFSTKFNPGLKSGGDYFDIFEHDDRLKFGVILSCCSGYTMSALFLSVLMKLSAQIEARKGLEPDKVLGLMAAEIVPQIQKNETASVFYGVIDRRSYELKYASIGNIMGLLQVHGQEQTKRLQPSTGPLRLDFNERPLTDTISLGSRDRLILCTEGVWNAASKNKENFGADRLLKAVQKAPRSGVHELRNEILFQISQFTESNDPDRDQTVLVTEIKDRVIKLAKKSPL